MSITGMTRTFLEVLALSLFLLHPMVSFPAHGNSARPENIWPGSAGGPLSQMCSFMQTFPFHAALQCVGGSHCGAAKKASICLVFASILTSVNKINASLFIFYFANP